MRLRFAECILDSGTRELFRNEHPVRLSPKAFQLLELLVATRPNAVSKEKIHESLWPGSFVVDGNLANLVKELRHAVGDDARQAHIIRTVHRFGYAFQAEAEASSDGRAAGADGVAHRLVWGDREIALAPGENLIGRDQDSVVWIDDFDVSRHHARIVIDASGARLEDLGSKNGTFLREERIGAPAALADGDLVRIGRASMIFRAFQRTGSTATASRR